MTRLNSPNAGPLKEIKGFWRSDGESSPASVSELSRTGAFIKTAFPARLGTRLELNLEIPGRTLSTQATVTRVAPGVGMAVEFKSLGEEDRKALENLVQQTELMQTLWLSRTSRLNPSNVGAGSTQVKDLPGAPPRNRRPERRSRMRHKFTATVALAEASSAKPIEARITELSRGGCFVKLDKTFPVGSTLQLSITENKQTVHARAVVASVQPNKGMGLEFAAVEPLDNLLLEEWLAASMERHWLTSNRRKAQRVMVNFPVHVIATNSVGTEIAEETTTVFVSPHGAMIQLEMHVAKGQRILLKDPSTAESLECSVDYLGPSTPQGRREVGVSFLLHNQTLWRIAFPEDYSPQRIQKKSESKN